MDKHRPNVPGVAELLLDLADGLKVSSAVEGVTAVEEQLDEVLGHIATSNIQTLGDMGQGVSLNNGHNMGHTITRVNDHTRQQSCCRKDRASRGDD